MQAADSMIWLPGDGQAVFGPPRQILAEADVTPPLAALARKLHWPEVPLSVREARRKLDDAYIGDTDASEHRLPCATTAETARWAVERRSGSAATPRNSLALAPRNDGTGNAISTPTISVQKLRVTYGSVLAVNDVSFELHPGEITALMGRNGSGKSSLMWALQGATASTGAIEIDGSDPRQVSERRARELVSLVPQTPGDLLYLPTVAEECAQADKESEVPAGTTTALLHRLGLELPPDRDPRDLSEGQRLALVLAIQLAATPKVVLLDEPTRGLDYAMKDHLTKILAQLAAQGTAILVSTHDVEFAAQCADRVIVLADGDIVADGPTTEVLTSSPAFSPQVAKVFWPSPLLTVADLSCTLDDELVGADS
jgi:energy-coupling factor transport system ATP-binding protein